MRRFICLAAAAAMVAACSLTPPSARSAPGTPNKGSFRFPVKHQSPRSAAEASGSTWTKNIERAGADRLSVHFGEFDLAPGDAMLVHGPDGQIDVYKGKGPDGSGSFWTAPVKGGFLTLEFVGSGRHGSAGFAIDSFEATFFDLNTVEARRAQVDSRYYQAISLDSFDEGERVIYGADDRLDVYEVSDPNLLELAQAAVAVTSAGEVSDNGDGTYTLDTGTFTAAGFSSLCPEEPFFGQATIGFCSGFLVGEDILVTAGHCIESQSECGSTAFVFGFDQQSESVGPDTVVPADNVYFCSQIIDQQLAGGMDHCVVRLDRPVVGRTPIPIRRGGNPAISEPLVMIGHPSTIPKKIAGGAEVKTDEGPFISANLDAYGGNSGSMVVSLDTFEIIGILVRGNQDFVDNGGCSVSNMLPDDNATFEEVSTTISFEQFIPELALSAGRLTLDSTAYNCSSTMSLDLRDADLEGAGTVDVTVATGSDTETVTLTETGADTGRFQADLAFATGAATSENGTLEVADGDSITATYIDADDGEGGMNVSVEAFASVDCVAPAISNVTATDIQGRRATITFDTDEDATATVSFGTACGSLDMTAGGGAATSHSIALANLTPLTTYFYTVQVSDAAGNVATDDNGASCFTFDTLEAPTEFFTELFDGAGSSFDLANSTATFSPDGSANFYGGCIEPGVMAFPTDPAGGTTLTLTDDGNASVTPSQSVSLYGQSFATFFVNSNGNITFDAGSGTTGETIAAHFGSPRVSALFDDLNPSAGGTVSWKETADRVAVTYEGVPQFNTTDSNSFQVELFLNGDVAITWLGIAAADGLAGLSAGEGVPEGFAPSDLSASGSCVGGAGELILDRGFYNCSDTIAIEVRDLDLAGTGSVDVDIASSGGSSNTVTLAETMAANGIFLGSINTTPGTRGGSLAVNDGETITVTYVDANDGMGGMDVSVVALALVDCVAPAISNVAISDVQPRQATVTFDTDEDAFGTADFGATCGSPDGSASGPLASAHSITLSGLTPNTTYFVTVSAADQAGNASTDDNGASCYEFTTQDAPSEFFTELFDGAGSSNDLAGLTLFFSPDGSANFYRACAEAASDFPTDPAGGTNVTLTDDSNVGATPSQSVSLYGTSYPSFFIGSNGYLTFTAGDTDFSETIADHFDTPRVSGIFDDLNPANGGTISWKETADRVAVTYDGTPDLTSGDPNRFQIEMYFDGTIAITYLETGSLDGIAGLSAGEGIPMGFMESDLGAAGSCVSGTGEIFLDKDFYSCADTVGVEVRDSDLAGTGSVDVNVATSGGDSETVSLTETGAMTGVFTGSIATANGFATTENGTLELQSGHTITATYMDADDGSGSPADATDTASSDCDAPAISNVAATDLLARQATVTFDTDEDAFGAVHYGTACGSLDQMATGGLGTSHSIVLTGLDPNTTYFFSVEAADQAGNVSTDDNGASCYTFTTLDAPSVFFTEVFPEDGSNDFDLDNTTLFFAPDGSANFYGFCGEAASAFPTDPAGGTPLTVADDGSVEHVLTGGTVSLYGVSYSSIFVGGNGYVTFVADAGAGTATESLALHFNRPRVSGFYDDLNPAAGGTISVRETADRVAVTYENVPEFVQSGGTSAGVNSFQIELYFDGTIAFTYLGMTQTDAIVGLSAGEDVPTGFAETDLSGYGSCLESAGEISLDAAAYSCSSVVAVQVGDLDLVGAGTVDVELTTSGGDIETLTLNETGADTGVFEGTIATAAGAAITGSVVLELSHGETITATYMDADDGSGSPATATAMAEADCQGPVISNVTVADVTGGTATITFDTDETASSLLSFGLACGALDGSQAGMAIDTAHSVLLTGLAESTTYFFQVSATDAVGNEATDDNGAACYQFATTARTNYFSEDFGGGGDGFDLGFSTLNFSFTGGSGRGAGEAYAVCSTAASAFPVDPSAATDLALLDDSSAEVALTDGAMVQLYGVAYSSVFVNANGNITFEGADGTATVTVDDHFNQPRVSALFTDLDPTPGTGAGRVSALQMADRLVVTWEGVTEFGLGNANDMQVHLYFNGDVSITYLTVDAGSGVVGLSAGGGAGAPVDFIEDNLDEFAASCFAGLEFQGVVLR